ncbi:hypothetical protein PC119_g92 [Phytophthora cactorum]|nr:hypothetical protein PC119_g92 [Phytophthora cactorum]
MEDEDFGEDVLVTTRAGGASVKEEAKTEESRATWEASEGSAVKTEKKDEEEDEDEELYGGVSIKLNASATSQAEAAAASAAASNSAADSKPSDDPAVDSDDDEDDEDVAIVLSTDHGSKPTLRFTGGGNRYVRGSFGGPQHGGPGAPGAGSMTGSQPGDVGGSATDGVDDMAMFGGRRTAFDVDIDLLEDRPWRKPGVDISDYFNYGFDEHSWREYAARQLRLRRDLAVEKSREQASRQAVNAANQQAMRDRDAKMQGRGGGGMPPRGFPGQIKQEGGDERPGEWGAGGNGMPPMGGAPPRGGGFMGGPPPRGWHPGMGPPPGFMGQQNWNGPPMGGAPWSSGPGRGPPWMGGRGRGGGRGGFDDRGRSGKDDRDDRHGVDVEMVLAAKMLARRTEAVTETEMIDVDATVTGNATEIAVVRMAGIVAETVIVGVTVGVIAIVNGDVLESAKVAEGPDQESRREDATEGALGLETVILASERVGMKALVVAEAPGVTSVTNGGIRRQEARRRTTQQPTKISII